MALTDLNLTLREMLAHCNEIHRNLEPIKIKMLDGTATDAEIGFFAREQDKSIALLRGAMDGKFKPTKDV